MDSGARVLRGAVKALDWVGQSSAQDSGGAALQIRNNESMFNVRRREVLLRDGLTFFLLSLTVLVLYGVTLFLFRTFEQHRDDLGKRWSGRGQQALTANDPARAIASLRAALQYAPDNRGYQLLLAEALARAGKTDEASSYFLNLRELKPGDGFINLQLARLARRKSDAEQAEEFYRASIFGDWQGTGVTSRRVVRLELADYLMERHNLPAARAELLIGAGNAPEDPKLNLLFGEKLEAAGDLQDALKLYQKAMAADPKSRVPPERAGRVALARGDYGLAETLLRRALATKPAGTAKEDTAELTALAGKAERLPQLSLSRELPAHERAEHLRLAAGIAQARLARCSDQVAAMARENAGARVVGDELPEEEMQGLRTRWKTANGPAVRRALLNDAGVQDGMTQLIYDTELRTQAACGAPTGDDALLLVLEQRATQAREEQERSE